MNKRRFETVCLFFDSFLHFLKCKKSKVVCQFGLVRNNLKNVLIQYTYRTFPDAGTE